MNPSRLLVKMLVPLTMIFDTLSLKFLHTSMAFKLFDFRSQKRSVQSLLPLFGFFDIINKTIKLYLIMRELSSLKVTAVTRYTWPEYFLKIFAFKTSQRKTILSPKEK